MTIVIAATGTQVTTSGTSSATAIPNANNGARAKRVRITVAIAAGFAYVRPGASGVTATANDLPVNFGAPVDLDVPGMTHIGAIEGSTACKINITPLENR